MDDKNKLNGAMTIVQGVAKSTDNLYKESIAQTSHFGMLETVLSFQKVLSHLLDNEEMIIKVEIMLKSITTFQLTETFNIPVMELLKDVTSLLIGEINEELKVPLSKNTNFERILNSYLYKMYETRWFPYVGLGYSYEFANNILSAISTNKDKMIEEVDSIIFEYFNDDIIKRIKKHGKMQMLPG